MRIINLTLLIVLIVLAIAFALLNSQIVTLHYFTGKSQLPLSLLLLATLAVGSMIGLLANFRVSLRNRRSTRELNKKVTRLNQELNNLRALPVKDTH